MNTDLMAPEPRLVAATGTDDDADYLRDRLRWLGRVRWFKAGGAAAIIALAYAMGILLTLAPALIVGAMVAYNLAFVLHARATATRDVSRLRRLIFLQLTLDVAALAAMLHWSDTIENPFVMFYAFPMVIGAMLLTRRQAAWLATTACALHAAVVLAEHAHLLPHHPLRLSKPLALELDEQLGSPWFVAGHLLAVVALLYGVTFFVRTVVEQRSRAEATRHQHEKVALSRARLAHVGEISAGVAHAVRNPLHGLMNCVELLETKVGSDPDAAESLEMMGEALRRIEGVTRRLLSLMRDAPTRPVTTDLDALVTDSIKFVSGRGRSKHVRLVTELGGVGHADVDPDRLSEALINVLDNAVDASADGASVTVRTCAGSSSDVRIEVCDHGAGMSPEALQMAFHPFFTTKPIGEGTGLGLAISKRIMEEHGGTIELESSPAAGTTVVLTLTRRFADERRAS